MPVVNFSCVGQPALAEQLEDMLGADLTAGAGFAGAETHKSGDALVITRLLIDLTGVLASTTLNDIIGDDGAASAHIGQVTAAACGTLIGGRMTCLELPAGAVTDIDLYSATVGTGAEDSLITDLTETALVDAGGVWTNGMVKGLTALPAANSYLYLTVGVAGSPGTYTAGKFLLELFGTD